VQIALDRRGDYSVRAVLDLARHAGGRRKAREIARVMDVPVRYLPQLLAPLIREGLVSATAGPEGGYALARDPSEISLLTVIECAEGSVESPRCVLRGGPCDWAETCPVHETWGRAVRSVAEVLRDTSFDRLAAADEVIQHRPVRERAPTHLEPVERRGVREAVDGASDAPAPTPAAPRPSGSARGRRVRRTPKP
jgi:Rrf2 family protein